MIQLIEFPDVNTFYIDEPVTTVPDFIAKSDIVDTLSYSIKWWYTSTPDEFYYQSGQNITFSSPSGNIDFCCLITETIGEESVVYDTGDLLGFNFHLKVLNSEENEYYKGEHESLEYDGYEDYNTYSGVSHKNNFKDSGISGYSGYSGVYLPVLNIIDSENVRLQKGYNDVLLDENLNPIYDDERDSFSLFTKYGLDPKVIGDQETFVKLQKFEQENFTAYNKKSSMLRILRPIDLAMNRLYQKIKELQSIKNKMTFPAGETIFKHQLVTLIDINITETVNITKAFVANAYSYVEDEETIYPKRCYGIALNDCVVGEDCEIQFSNIIEDFNFWWNPSFDFSETVNRFYYLHAFGRMEYIFPDPDDISFISMEYVVEDYIPPVLCQRIGYPIDIDKFVIDIGEPYYRHLTEIFGGGGG